ncbi:YkvA family protein [Jiulongibacter sediminis]|nr:YkvA family protein [Jiulongibacter sediminis]
MSNQSWNEDMLKRVLKSVFFKNSMGKAGRISRNAGSLLALLKNALNKTQELGVGGAFDSIREKVVTLGKLLKAYASGQYRDIELKNLIIMIASLVYFLSPIDLVPDFLPLLGYADDIALLTYVLRSVAEEVEKFELWEMNKDLN